MKVLEQEKLKRVGLTNLFYFNQTILGYVDMQESPHRLMCDSASNRTKLRKQHLWPRGHFKSTMITVGYALQRICENPDIRILIANDSLSNAKSFLREIKGHLERNLKLRELYGDHVSDARESGKWTDTQIISALRTKNLKEPTIQVAGVGQALASQHYDLIIGDDLVNELTVTTPEQIQKTIDWFQMAYSLLEPDGEMIDIGTRYHLRDLHGWIANQLKDEFDIQVHSVFVDDDQAKGVIFPEKFSKDIVAAIRKAQGSYKFSCQYRNKPISSENAKFKEEDFRYYLDGDLTGRSLYTTMTVDRAYSLAGTADFTGITVRSMDLEGNWFVRYAKRHKQLEGDIINSIFNIKNHFKVDRVGIEQKAFKYTLKPVLDTEMRRRQDFFTVVELKDKHSKIMRIESLVPLFESHSMYFLKDDMQDLEDELTSFPMGGHDDVADALAYHNDEEMRGSPRNPALKSKIMSHNQRALAGMV